jgi:hypothetical protein
LLQGSNFLSPVYLWLGESLPCQQHPFSTPKRVTYRINWRTRMLRVNRGGHCLAVQHSCDRQLLEAPFLSSEDGKSSQALLHTDLRAACV